MNKKNEFPPISLKEIQIKEYKGIKDLVIEDIPKKTPWIFLTGQNGYGKTCLLQAMFMGLQNNPTDGISILAQGDFEIGIIFRDYDEEKKYKVTSNLYGKIFRESLKKISSVQFVFGYGPQRLSIQNSNVDLEKESKYSTNGYGLFYQDGILLNIETYLKSWYYRSNLNDNITGAPIGSQLFKSYFESVIDIFLKLMPNLSRININTEIDRVVYFEKDSHGIELDKPRFFEQLASGNKVIITLIGDLIVKLMKNLGIGMITPSEFIGTVIIDELDLHLHPAWQKRLPQILSEIFPKIQFIASTHSPIPFLGAPEGSVFIKVNRDAERGIWAEKVDIDISNLTPNTILSSPIFGFTEIFPVTHDENEPIRTEDTFKEIMHNDQLEKSLKSFLGTEKEEELRKLLKKRG